MSSNPAAILEGSQNANGEVVLTDSLDRLLARSLTEHCTGKKPEISPCSYVPLLIPGMLRESCRGLQNLYSAVRFRPAPPVISIACSLSDTPESVS